MTLVLAGVLVASVFAVGIPLGIEPSWRPNYHSFLGGELIARGELVAGLEAFEHALAAAPEDAELHNFVAYSLAISGMAAAQASRSAASKSTIVPPAAT